MRRGPACCVARDDVVRTDRICTAVGGIYVLLALRDERSERAQMIAVLCLASRLRCGGRCMGRAKARKDAKSDRRHGQRINTYAAEPCQAHLDRRPGRLGLRRQ